MGKIAAIALCIALQIPASAWAQNHLSSPYRHQAEAGLRGLDETEIAELKAGNGMGMARAAELNGYPGPRHVLDAAAAGKLPTTPEQIERIQRIFDAMQRDAQRLGAQILEQEQRLEAAFRTGTIIESDVRDRVARISALRGQVRSVHLAAHLATRAILSDSQIARYNELRGYTAGAPDHSGHQHKH